MTQLSEQHVEPNNYPENAEPESKEPVSEPKEEEPESSPIETRQSPSEPHIALEEPSTPGMFSLIHQIGFADIYNAIAAMQRKLKIDTAVTEKIVAGRTLPTISAAQKDKALNEIFHFYSKQYVTSTTKKTFEGVNKELNRLEVPYFLKLAKDFRFPFDTKKLKEIFVKNALCAKYINVETLETLLEQIAIELYKECNEMLSGKLKELPREKVMEILYRLMCLHDPNIVSICLINYEDNFNNSTENYWKDSEERHSIRKTSRQNEFRTQ